MKKFGISLALVGLLGLGGQAFAEIGAIDPVPAATLLLPYFEVDLDAAEGEGVTTLFSINNASAAPALAHVTIWSNWSQPVIDFDVFLTGYDVQTVNLYNVLVNGNLPVTADEAGDGGDTVSPHAGPNSNNPAWDGSIGQCVNFLPWTNPILTGALLERAQNGTTGQVVNGLGCMGLETSAGVATGYITIDSMNDCSTDFPNQDDYFAADGNGLANNNNVLWGDYNIVDVANASAHGDTLVHVEAANGFTAASTPTGYTFYGRYTATNAIAGDDNREPLGTTWGARFSNGGAFSGGTDLVVWRDSTADDTSEYYGCGTGGGPSWYPLNETQVVSFNEAEDAIEICYSAGGGVISPPTGPDDPACFPLETQRVAYGAGNLTVPHTFGWVYLNLNLPPDAPVGDVDFGSDGNIAQSHVSAVHSALGLYSTGYSAIQLSNGTEDSNALIAGAGN